MAPWRSFTDLLYFVTQSASVILNFQGPDILPEGLGAAWPRGRGCPPRATQAAMAALRLYVGLFPAQAAQLVASAIAKLSQMLKRKLQAVQWLRGLTRPDLGFAMQLL